MDKVIKPGINGKTFKIMFNAGWLDGFGIKAKVVGEPERTEEGFKYPIEIIEPTKIVINAKQALHIMKQKLKL